MPTFRYHCKILNFVPPKSKCFSTLTWSTKCRMKKEKKETQTWEEKKKIECNVASYSFPPVIFLLEILYE